MYSRIYHLIEECQEHSEQLYASGKVQLSEKIDIELSKIHEMLDKDTLRYAKVTALMVVEGLQDVYLCLEGENPKLASSVRETVNKLYEAIEVL